MPALWVATGTTVVEDPPTSAGWNKRVVRHLIGEGTGSTGAPAPDFTLGISPSSRTAAQGETTAAYTVTVQPTNGFSGSVSLIASGLLAGETPTFTPTPTTTTSALTIALAANATVGSDAFTVVGTSGALTRQVAATVVVTASTGFPPIVGPQNIAKPAGAITAPAGTDAAVFCAAQAQNATIWFPAGVYPTSRFYNPKNQIIVGQQGAIFDGAGALDITVQGEGSNPTGNTTFRNLEFRNFRPTGQHGVFHLYSGATWNVDYCYIHDCGSPSNGCGFTGSDTETINVTNTRIATIGVTGGGGNGGLWQDCELDFNCPSGQDPVGSAAGAKYWGGSGVGRLIFRRLYSHDNKGHGLWCDGGVIGSLWDSCTSNDNTGAGMHHEISGQTRMTASTLAGNGLAGVYLFCAEDVEVDHMTISGSPIAFSMRTSVRSFNGHTYGCKNIDVHDNDVTLAAGEMATTLIAEASVASDWFTQPANNVTFRLNTYRLTSGNWSTAQVFQINSTKYTKAQWQALGFDTDSTFV